MTADHNPVACFSNDTWKAVCRSILDDVYSTVHAKSDGAAKEHRLFGTNARMSFTGDLGGAANLAALNGASDVTFSPGDAIEINAVDLKDLHKKQGTVVVDMGQTKNGPRICVRLGDSDQELAIPPGCITKVAASLVSSKPSFKAKSRLSFTGDLGGISRDLDAESSTEVFAQGDRVEVDAAELKKYHGLTGTVIEDIGQTPNGPRIIVRIDFMEDSDMAFPPSCLLKTEKPAPVKKKSAKTRLSFTSDLGGVCPGIVQAAGVVPFADTFAVGDPIEVDAPSLSQYHGKAGTIVMDLGMTPNGPRIAVQLIGMEDVEVAMPPACLVRVEIENGTEHAAVDPRTLEKRASNAHMRGDCMSGCLEFIPFEDSSAKNRLSFTGDLGGVDLSAMDAITGDEVQFEEDDRVEIDAPELPRYHGAKGIVVKDLGQTPNGPRIAVKLEGVSDKDIAFPPSCLVPLD